jgi:two-component system response regulator VicR
MEPAILLIEDDREISSMIAKHLEREGMRVIQAYDGQAALSSFQQNAISLVPILILSAKNSELDKALGLGLGADDYIAKPFSLIELTARVRAAIRRSTLYTQASQAAPTLQTIGDLEVDLDNFRVLKQGQELKLTPKEFLILKLLVGNPQRVFSKAQIYREVWEDEYFGDENVLNVHIRRLREKIEDDPANPRYVQTVWGIGYKLGSL